MPRSIEEIDADIAAVQQQMSMRNALGYKAARAKAILDHDTSGLERIYSLMNQAEQNKLQREMTESENEKNRQNYLRIAKLGKESAAEEQEITWRKDIALAANTLRQVKQQQAKGLADEFDVTAAEEAYNALVDKGVTKGYGNVPAASVKQEAISSAEPTGDNKSVRENYLAVINNPDGATDEDLDMAELAAASLWDRDSVAKVKSIRAKRKTDAEKHADDELIKVIDDDLKGFNLTKASAAIKQIKDAERRKTYEDKLAKRRKVWNTKQHQKNEDAGNPFFKNR